MKKHAEKFMKELKLELFAFDSLKVAIATRLDKMT